jgi:hypothetical protein
MPKKTEHKLLAELRKFDTPSNTNVVATYPNNAPLADRTRQLRAWSLFMQTYPLVLAPVSQGRRSLSKRI